MAAAPVQPPAATEQVAATPEDFIGAARQLRALLEAKEAVARPRPSSGERGTVLDSVRGALNRAVLALEETDTAAAAAANAAVASRQAAAAAEEAAAACARRAGACRRALLDAQGELRLESAGEAAAAEAPAAKKRKREIRLALMGEQGALSLAKLERKLREEMALRKDREEEVERLRFELGVAQANLKQAEDSSAIKDASTEKLEKCFGKNKWHGMVKDWALCVETARNEENMRWLAGQLRQRTKEMALEAENLATKLRQRGCEDLAAEVEKRERDWDDLASQVETSLEVSPEAREAAAKEVITRLGMENDAYKGHCEAVGAPITDAATGRLTRGGNACVSASARASSEAQRPRDAGERRRAAGPVPKF